MDFFLRDHRGGNARLNNQERATCAKTSSHRDGHPPSDGAVDSARMSEVGFILFAKGESSFRALEPFRAHFCMGQGVRPLAPPPRHNDPHKTSQLDVSLPMKMALQGKTIAFSRHHPDTTCKASWGCVSPDETRPLLPSAPLVSSVSLAMSAVRRDGLSAVRLSAMGRDGLSALRRDEPSAARPGSRELGRPRPPQGGCVSPDETPETALSGGVSLPMKNPCLSAQAIQPRPLRGMLVSA